MPLNVDTFQVEMNGKLERMMDGIDAVKDKQDEMALDIGKIKEAVYNPDEGIYARMRELEQWKKTSSRMIWILTVGGVTLFFTIVKDYLSGKI